MSFMSSVLRQSDIGRIKGALRVLEATGNKKAARIIVDALALKSFRLVTNTAIKVAYKLDHEFTRPYLFRWLASRHAQLRKEAEKFLRTRIGPGDVETLGQLVYSKRKDTRLRALRLLSRLSVPGSEKYFIHALSDKAVVCAKQAAFGISLFVPFPEEVKAIIREGPLGGKRFGFAVLAAVMHDAKYGDSVMDPGWKDALLKGLKSSDPFIRTVSATALALLSFYSSDLEGKKFKDTEVMDTLVRAITVKEFFPEFGIVIGPAEEAARLLAGKKGKFTAGEWKSWWEIHSDTFVANRAALDLDKPDNRKLTVVRLEDPVESIAVAWEKAPYDPQEGEMLIRTMEKEQDGLVFSLREKGILLRAREQARRRILDETGKQYLKLSLLLKGRELSMEALPGTDWM